MKRYKNPTHQRRYENGLCVMCGRPVEMAYTHCALCVRKLKYTTMISDDGSRVPITHERPLTERTIFDICRKADQLGMSYGQYMALMRDKKGV